MDFREVVGRRRMVRRFAQRPVPRGVVDRILDIGRRAPSAGFSQGLELLVLDAPETVATFWETTSDPDFGWDPDEVANGPTVLILPLPDARRYVERYSQPDKIAFGMDEEDNWPVRFWEIDAAMSAMLILLAAVDEGLGGWFFGITHGERELLDRFGVPEHVRPIGIIGLGYRAEDEEPSGSWMKLRRRAFEEQVHRNGW
ncbi:MAG TPA: nitroreductase family protein [Actinomycetota bacterium]|nr:nitroreductase family protein [Actinomycetota bacterium]